MSSFTGSDIETIEPDEEIDCSSFSENKAAEETFQMFAELISLMKIPSVSFSKDGEKRGLF